MFCKRTCLFLSLALALVALTFGSACRRQPVRPSLEKIAVLRFENLSANDSSDWMGRAFSEIIASELGGTPSLYAIPGIRIHAVVDGLGGRPATVPGISAERTAAIAAGATKIVYGQYEVRGGTVDVQATVEDELTGQMTGLKPVLAPVSEIVPEASDLARQISPHASPYGTKNAFVVQTFVTAMERSDATQARADSLQKAIALDPNFGPPYRQLAQWKAQQNDASGALEVLNQGLARGSAIPEAERARFQMEQAALRNDLAARLDALTAVAKSDPYDPQTWQDLAAANMATHRYPQAAEAYGKLTALQPDDATFWNLLAYASANSGDTPAALKALDRYRSLSPGSPNPVDSFGDVNLLAGHLREAEDFYLKNAKQYPEFYAGLDYLKAALAHLMTGDVPGADSLAQQYFAAREAAKDPALAYRKAQWAWISGRRKDACRQMEQLAAASETGAGRNMAGHAYTELAIWTLMLGNREAAAQFALKAAALATPESAVQITMARFLSQPSVPAAEWKTRAEALVRQQPQSPIGKAALADALLFSKEFADAQPVLQAMYDSGNGAADEGLPVLLAWADVETGKIPEAATLLRFNPPLADVGISWSTPLYFPRIFYLRAVVAEKQGKPDEARENWRVFHALSGPDPLMWGEEQKSK